MTTEAGLSLQNPRLLIGSADVVRDAMHREKSLNHLFFEKTHVDPDAVVEANSRIHHGRSFTDCPDWNLTDHQVFRQHYGFPFDFSGVLIHHVITVTRHRVSCMKAWGHEYVWEIKIRVEIRAKIERATQDKTEGNFIKCPGTARSTQPCTHKDVPEATQIRGRD